MERNILLEAEACGFGVKKLVIGAGTSISVALTS